MHHPDLYTNRLRLRLIQPSDAEFILQGLSYRRVTQHYAVQYDTLNEVQEQMRFYHDLLENGTGAWWAFSLKHDGKLLGTCGLNNLEKERRKAGIGFWLPPEHWGATFQRLPEQF